MKNPREQSTIMHTEGRGILPKSFAWLSLGVAVVLSLALSLCSCEPAYPAEQFKITAYCACKKCCLKSDGITASGKHAKANHTIACNWLPFGTKVNIAGKLYFVEDRGAKSLFGSKQNHIKHIDIFYSNHNEALKQGVKWLPVEVL